jgi:hypothetical protein
MKARPFPRPVRVYHIVAKPKEGGGHTYEREVLHARGVLHAFGTDSDEREAGNLVYSVGIVELADGSVILPYANMVQFLDVSKWKFVTEVGQVLPGHRLRFTIGDDQHHASVKQILNPGTPSEEIIYDKGRNFYFITSMVAAGTSNHKNVEFFDTRGE